MASTQSRPQSGGCDHTIECGTKLIELRATDLASAQAEAMDLLGPYSGERELSRLIVHQVVASRILDIKQAYLDLEAHAKSLQEAENTTMERNEFERLKGIFGGQDPGEPT